MLQPMMCRLVVLLCILVSLVSPARAGVVERVAEDVARLAPGALVLVLDKNGRPLVSQNADRPFVPASVAKIATAWLALETLGADYRFQTRFFVDFERRLYVQGGGDPFLISEELAVIAPKLIAASGGRPFSSMVLDTSYYPKGLRIPGVVSNDQPYNALNSALAVNFNTINAVRNGNSVRSAEPQTPITPIAISQFRARGPNGRGRISLAQENPEVSALYTGELLAEFIKAAGGKVEGDIVIGKVPATLQPVLVHRQTRPLSQILAALMDSSNNYITNQVFLEIGANRFGGPVSLEKSRKVANELLAKHGIQDGIHMVEGSGISRDNRFTARGLGELLNLFAPHAGLMSKSRHGSRYKTGTLSGVSTLAGYANTNKHGTVRFVISIKGQGANLRFRLLEAIEEGL